MQAAINVQGLLRKRRVCDQPRPRRRMIARLALREISAKVLQAMALVPRHAFVHWRFASQAYVDRPLCVGKTSLTDPCCIARMTDQLHLNCTKRVLEIGTGTGYHTVILALLSGQVFTIERIPSLVKESAEAFAALATRNIWQRLGDGFLGWPEAAPFAAILVTAAAPFIPRALVRQLDPKGGRMVIPVGPPGGCQRLYLLERRADRIRTADLGPVTFVPFVPGCGEQGVAPRSAYYRSPSSAGRRCAA